MDDSAFAGVIADLAVILRKELFARTIGGASYCLLPFAALYLCNMEMVG